MKKLRCVDLSKKILPKAKKEGDDHPPQEKSIYDMLSRLFLPAKDV